MYHYNELLDKVNQALREHDVRKAPEYLYTPISYEMSLGGKRLRPVLMLMAYNLYHEDVDYALLPAIGLETYHNFTLLHDDVMDHAEVRRGKPCVHRKWNENTAILSGDHMLIMAMQRICQCHPRHLPDMMQLFSQTAIEIDEGQQYDMDFEQRDNVTEEEYIEMIRLKTSVLLACALKMGAVLADASNTDATLLYDFGEKMGLAFQLQDDYLDVYGDPSTFGKQIGGDIMEGKKTFMLINALAAAKSANNEELTYWMNNSEASREEKVNAVRSIYNKLGIPQLAKARIEAYTHEALASLNQLPLPENRKQTLRDVALKLLNRDK
ncbi:MAG: polyprenyl synthetase family protein [Bacteroidales bacterium]|nr:polyprenyl synthetase family protein [Candidatus Physcousia equi]